MLSIIYMKAPKIRREIRDSVTALEESFPSVRGAPSSSLSCVEGERERKA